MFCNHDWSEWQTFLVMDGVTYQSRICNKCGLTQQRDFK